MLESLTVATILFLLLAYFRPGKTPPLENPLLITRAGKYQLNLAPKLNLAQPFIEEVAKRTSASLPEAEGSAVRYFVVRDNQVRAHGSDKYLMAICYRDKMLYFYAANPHTNREEEYLNAIKAYSVDCMSGFPESDGNRASFEAIISAAVNEVAQERGIEIHPLIS